MTNHKWEVSHLLRVCTSFNDTGFNYSLLLSISEETGILIQSNLQMSRCGILSFPLFPTISYALTLQAPSKAPTPLSLPFPWSSHKLHSLHLTKDVLRTFFTQIKKNKSKAEICILNEKYNTIIS